MVLVQRETPYPHWEFSDPGSGDLLRLVPERGGLISGWRSGGRERLYFDLERFRDPALSVRGGIPVLFPICGGLPGGVLSLPQGRFPMAQHGFARELPWRMRPLEDGRGVALELEHCGATLAQYPFRFQLRLEVRLEPRVLAIRTEVGNQGQETMPFSFGLHPYIAVADLSTARFEGLPARGLDQRTGQECDTDQQLDLLAEGIDLLAGPARAVRLLDPSAGTALELETTAPLDLVVIWSDPPRPMACLEPWSAPRGALASGQRRLELKPGESQHLDTTYRVLA
ncbi:MAG: galactose mutarotase [Prochlorococcaceae cyanobacterium]